MVKTLTINDTKKQEILKFLGKNEREWFTLNQIRNQMKIHIYKAELLMYQLLSDNKVELDKKGKFIFWRVR